MRTSAVLHIFMTVPDKLAVSAVVSYPLGLLRFQVWWRRHRRSRVLALVAKLGAYERVGELPGVARSAATGSEQSS